MPSLAHEMELLARIQGLIHGNNVGLTAGFGDDGGALIERRGHLRGIWRCMDGGFSWTPAGYNEPVFQAKNLEDAVTFTLSVLSQ